MRSSAGITRRDAVAVAVLGGLAPAVRGQAAAVVQVAASLHVLLLLGDGSVVALGENRSGQLGRPRGSGDTAAGRVALPAPAVQVAAGGDTSYAVLADGSVWAWGRGYHRQLGEVLAQGTERPTPKAVPGLQDIRAVAASPNGALALAADGSVSGWGELPKVLLRAEPEFPGSAVPLRIAGLADVAQLVWNGAHGLALTSAGRVLAFGRNAGGQLGLGTAGEAQPPTAVPSLEGVVSVAVTDDASFAVTRDGRVWSWGHNRQAGLGHGERADVGDPGQPRPAPVPGVAGAAAVAAGTFGRHVIVRTARGTLIGWGNSDWGQLGAGVSAQFQPRPTAIRLADVQAHWLGGNFSFARTGDGSLWFWGERSGAQVLLGARGHQTTPGKVSPAVWTVARS